MDLSFEMPSLYDTDDTKKISDLETRLNTEINKFDSLTENVNKLSTQINTQNDRLNRHRAYFDVLLKNIQDISKIQISQINKINDIIAKYNNVKDVINARDEELIILVNKQKELEIQILEKQKQQDIEISELRRMIQKQPEETNINTQVTSKNKRPFNKITEDYIEQLKLTKKRSNRWSNGMSKYISITLVNDKWRWETPIFGQRHINFKLKEEAEKHYENIISKYNIDPIHITREGYNS